jgi:hypothetical protein
VGNIELLDTCVLSQNFMINVDDPNCSKMTPSPGSVS